MVKILLISFLFTSTLWAQSSSQKTVTTVAGKLDLSIQNENVCVGLISGVQKFKFDCESQFSPIALGIFKLKDEDFEEVLVIQERPMGNACNGGPIHVFGVQSSGKFKPFGTMDFCGGQDPVIEDRTN